MRRKSIIFLTICFLLGASPAYAYWIWTPKSHKWTNPKTAVKPTPKEQFELAKGAFDAKQYEDAKREFRKLLKAYPKSLEAAESQYYLALVEEADDNPYAAFGAYQKVIDKYPFSERIPEIIEREYKMWLFLAYGEKLWDLDLGLIKRLDKGKWQVLQKMYLSGFNSPLSSSIGRLFDAVASLVLTKPEARFEAELAIELERLAARFNTQARAYAFKIIKEPDQYILDPLPLFKEVINDLKHNEAKEKIAYRFHLTVAEATKKILLMLRNSTGLNIAVLSGGVFQNHILYRMIREALRRQDFRVLVHCNIPCHDAG
ncbi:MAG: tetratricopeptide repeat protein, partial [bacterium]